jgi:hypothetical protein
MRIGLDIDDTITRCPEFFALLSQAFAAAGHVIYIISFRAGREATAADLEGWGITYHHLILPSDEDLGGDGFYEWKARVCRDCGIDLFFEDMPEVLNRLDDSTIGIMPVDPWLGEVTYHERGEPTEPR